MNENKSLKDDGSNSAKNKNSAVDRSKGDGQISNKEIKESSQGTKLNNVNSTEALQEQAKKDDDVDNNNDNKYR